jgi:exonuclease VII small subunit
MSAEYVVKLLKISNNDLPALESKYKKLQENVDHLESKELDLSITLKELKSQQCNYCYTKLNKRFYRFDSSE